MSEQPMNDSYYVAPVEAPASRRPPVTATGLIGWLKENLFSSIFDTIVTLVTIALVALFLWRFLGWAMLEAQWEVAFLNLRELSVGQQFPRDEIWRITLIAQIIVFLSLLSVGVWGRLTRSVAIVILTIIAFAFIVPFASRTVPEPPIYTFVAENYSVRQVNFIAQEGQEITFTLAPLTSPEEYALADIDGYIEDDNQQANTSFDAFNTVSRDIDRELRDPAEFDLNVSLQVWNIDGLVIEESAYSSGSTDDIVLEFTAPYSGWFTYTAVFDEENPGTIGSAWVIADNIDVYRSTTGAQLERVEEYGEAPPLDCPGCGTATNRTDMRFQGTRTVAQWFSLQLTPFLLETRSMFILMVIVGAVAYAIGKLTTMVGLAETPALKATERLLLIFSALWIVGWLGVQVANAANPTPAMDTLRLFIMASFVVTLFIYAVLQFSKGSPQASSQAVTLMWVLSFPVVITLLTGFTNVQPDAPLPPIQTGLLGGMLLTLLLSAVAIIASFPIGMMLAIGRQSELPVVSLLCTVFIEVLRGVPLITLLFMGRLILPFFGFGLGDVDLVIRIMVVLTLFTSAYLAEVIRGGLQIVPRGQLEASGALGLNGFWTTVLIVLPQALRAVIPAIMGQAVSLFKDTSLVYIVSLFEILGTMNQILGDSQTGYIAFPREGYLFVGIVYFVFSYIMADVSRRIERTGSGAVRRDTI
ncbi:MAG: amino acid ABC transporter permease [Aggregatilineales bacterium]